MKPRCYISGVAFAAYLELVACWIVWWYPFILRAPHRQKRESIALPGATRVGLLLEAASFAVALWFRLPSGTDPGLLRIVPAMVLAPLGPILGWTAVVHLGRQFRITAGLYHDHELVRTGPYALVRHPIYASLLAMLLGTGLLLSSWLGLFLALAIFVTGTEIRVAAEEKLLASRFGESFQAYRQNVPAYLPWVR